MWHTVATTKTTMLKLFLPDFKLVFNIIFSKQNDILCENWNGTLCWKWETNLIHFSWTAFHTHLHYAKPRSQKEQILSFRFGGPHSTTPVPPLAHVCFAIQSQYELWLRYKYSDPAVVLMSKVYQTTDSIHVETVTLPGNSSTNRDRAGVCLSLSEYHYGMSSERERKSERRCLSLLIMQHHSLCIDPAGWSCLHIVGIKIIFS